MLTKPHLEGAVVAATEQQVLGTQGVPRDDVNVGRMRQLRGCDWLIDSLIG